jgi:hypothetical protein
MVGNQIPAIFPIESSDPYDNQTAAATSQLQPIPERNA